MSLAPRRLIRLVSAPVLVCLVVATSPAPGADRAVAGQSGHPNRRRRRHRPLLGKVT